MVRASRLMAPVLTVLAQARASQPMVPVRALPGQASHQMAPVLALVDGGAPVRPTITTALRR